MTFLTAQAEKARLLSAEVGTGADMFDVSVSALPRSAQGRTCLLFLSPLFPFAPERRVEVELDAGGLDQVPALVEVGAQPAVLAQQAQQQAQQAQQQAQVQLQLDWVAL